MSELQKLKSTVETISRSSKQSATSLRQLKSTFSKHSQDVHSAIGGSSQQKDRAVMQAIDEATKQVESAAAALEKAAKVASDYSRSL